MKKVELKSHCYNKLGEELSTLVSNLYTAIQDVYLADNRPWVIGYSGGKDSTVTLQSVWYALSMLPKKKLTKPIYIISSDTYVETPIIVNYVDSILNKINKIAKRAELPFKAHKVVPLINDTFWVNMIGRGYPAPYSRFRWCTDRLKIKPANRFITEKIALYGEVVVVLGARKNESSSRAGFMKKRKEIYNHLFQHSSLANAWVFTPIEDWYTDEVWKYLLAIPSPWDADNSELISMYKNAQDGECPLVIDKSTPPCGNSRFGCWTCTVVDKDTSMESMIRTGAEWMQPLLNLRDWLVATQNPEVKKNIRNVRRRTGKVQYKNINGSIKLIWGPYTLAFRKEILIRLLEAQLAIQKNGPNPHEVLISTAELLKIRQLWFFEEGDWQDSLPQIYKQVTGKTLDVLKDDWSGMRGFEFQVLQEISVEHNVPVGLLTELFDAERRQHGMSRRSAIYNDIDNLLKKDWQSREEVLTGIEIEAKAGNRV